MRRQKRTPDGGPTAFGAPTVAPGALPRAPAALRGAPHGPSTSLFSPCQAPSATSPASSAARTSPDCGTA